MHKKQKLVIVEDDVPLLEMYRMKFELSGFDVVTAENGQEGLVVIEKHRPALVLLDIKMPIMDGAEMLAKLRQTEWGSSVRVIILTNISRDEAPQSLRFLSVDRYVVKAHHTPAQILQVVETVLS